MGTNATVWGVLSPGSIVPRGDIHVGGTRTDHPQMCHHGHASRFPLPWRRNSSVLRVPWKELIGIRKNGRHGGVYLTYAIYHQRMAAQITRSEWHIRKQKGEKLGMGFGFCAFVCSVLLFDATVLLYHLYATLSTDEIHCKICKFQCYSWLSGSWDVLGANYYHGWMAQTHMFWYHYSRITVVHLVLPMPGIDGKAIHVLSFVIGEWQTLTFMLFHWDRKTKAEICISKERSKTKKMKRVKERGNDAQKNYLKEEAKEPSMITSLLLVHPSLEQLARVPWIVPVFVLVHFCFLVCTHYELYPFLKGQSALGTTYCNGGQGNLSVNHKVYRP